MLNIYWFLNVKICCFSLSFFEANEEHLGFGLLVGRQKESEDVTSVIFRNVLC